MFGNLHNHMKNNNNNNNFNSKPALQDTQNNKSMENCCCFLCYYQSSKKEKKLHDLNNLLSKQNNNNNNNHKGLANFKLYSSEDLNVNNEEEEAKELQQLQQQHPIECNNGVKLNTLENGHKFYSLAALLTVNETTNGVVVVQDVKEDDEQFEITPLNDTTVSKSDSSRFKLFFKPKKHLKRPI
jgi:hypothetical protein